MRRFVRTIEDFVCDRCGEKVTGNGYTNHCPQCLWSKHVDENPGDRAEACGGMMEPVGVTEQNGEWVIIHRCIFCGFSREQKTSPCDNFNVLIELAPYQK